MPEIARQIPVMYVFSRSCPSHEEGLELLHAAAAEAGVGIAVEQVEVISDDHAEEIGFAGSPTYMIGGRDVAEPDPLMPARMDTCRAYALPDGRVGPLPARATLVDALREAA